MGLSSLFLRCNIARQYSWTTQVVTALRCRYIYWTLNISCIISSSGSKPSNWTCLTSIPCGVWWWISTVPFMREGTITPKWTNHVQRSSKIGVLDNIDLKDTWFNPDLEEDPSATPIHDPSIAPENATFSKSVPHVQKGPASKGSSVSELFECPASKEVRNRSNFLIKFLSFKNNPKRPVVFHLLREKRDKNS